MVYLPLDDYSMLGLAHSRRYDGSLQRIGVYELHEYAVSGLVDRSGHGEVMLMQYLSSANQRKVKR